MVMSQGIADDLPVHGSSMLALAVDSVALYHEIEWSSHKFACAQQCWYGGADKKV